MPRLFTLSLTLVVSLTLMIARVAVADCHTGSDVVVHLSSPIGSGIYATPLRVTASATSSKTITGYVVYTNATGSYANAYQNNGRTTLDAWVILPLTGTGGPKGQSVFVRAWNSGGILWRQFDPFNHSVRHTRANCARR